MPERICSVEGCGRPHKARGLCSGHNERRRKGRESSKPLRQREFGGICTVEGCRQPRQWGRAGSALYCPMHRMRLARRGVLGDAERQRALPGEAVWNTPEYRRRKSRLAKYGLTPEEFDRLLAVQGGRCAICRTTKPQTARVGTWCVDHDHVTGQVRGLLCAHCNRGIGLLQDDPQVLASAAQYIQRHRQMVLPLDSTG